MSKMDKLFGWSDDKKQEVPKLRKVAITSSGNEMNTAAVDALKQMVSIQQDLTEYFKQSELELQDNLKKIHDRQDTLIKLFTNYAEKVDKVYGKTKV